MRWIFAKDFVQRVVALPGDMIEMDGGHPIINDWPVPSCSIGRYTMRAANAAAGELWMEYLGEAVYLIWLAEREQSEEHKPHRVSVGEVWVLGDNRNSSFDSRFWNGGRGGGVPLALVKGAARFIWLAFDGENGSVNWGRIGIDLPGAPTFPEFAPADLKTQFDHCLARRPARTLPPAPQ